MLKKEKRVCELKDQEMKSEANLKNMYREHV